MVVGMSGDAANTDHPHTLPADPYLTPEQSQQRNQFAVHVAKRHVFNVRRPVNAVEVRGIMIFIGKGEFIELVNLLIQLSGDNASGDDFDAKVVHGSLR